MAFRRRAYRRKKVYRRRPVRRYRRSRPRNRLDASVVNVKLRSVEQIYANGSGLVQQSIIPEAEAQSNPDWSSYSNLYDMFRVRAMKVKFIPSGNVVEATILNGGSTETTSSVPLYVFYDPDQSSFPGTVTSDVRALEYANCKSKWSIRPWSYYKRLVKISSVNTVAGAYGIRQGGWLDIASAPTSGTQQIAIFKDTSTYPKFINNQSVGTFIITCYTQFKVKR